MKATILVFMFLILLQTASGTDNIAQDNTTNGTNVTIPSAPTGVTYTVFVDREFGFWGVRSDNSSTVNYANKTLDVKTGDSVRWINMDGNDDRVTVVSDNNFWENGTVLSGTGKTFTFTFNSSGTYRFHIVENSHINLNASNYTENKSQYTTITYCTEYDEAEEECLKQSTLNIKRTRRNANQQNLDYLKATTDVDRFVYQTMTLKVSGLMVGNGTFPIKKNVTAGEYSAGSGYNYSSRTGISVDARPKPTAIPVATPTVTAPPKPLESYHEFTLFEILKRWYTIILGTD